MPRRVDEVKKPETFRLKPSVRMAIIQEYGSVTVWINSKIKTDRNLQKRLKANESN